jgi:hypothetical protein
LSGAARVLERCDALARISEEPTAITRRFGTPAMKEANALVAGWMREAGLETREDPLGNLIGRRGDRPAMMVGSHLDTVIDAGRYDGPLGVLIGIEAAERVQRDIEVVGFADEEGCRFGTAYLGSSVMAGRFKLEWLSLSDDEGVRLGDLVHDIPAARDDVLGYVEVHIEQGPVLERLGEPVGVVTAINGQSHAAAKTNETSQAWNATVSYVLTGEDNTFLNQGIKPRHPFDPFDGHWGAFQAAARFSSMNFDNDVFQNIGTAEKPIYPFADPRSAVANATTWALGVNWWLNPNYKLMFDYSQTAYNDGAGTFSNSGALLPYVRSLQTEKVWQTRVQVNF